MMAAVERDADTRGKQDEKASNRFAARRALAAATAAVSVQESQALSRAAAEGLTRRRSERVVTTN
jgi:hypothetical protein